MQAIERLEFGAIRAALLARTHTPLGASEVNRLVPFERREEAIARVEAIRQTRLLFDLAAPPPVWGAEDVTQALELGEKGIMLEGAQLRATARTMQTGADLRRHLVGHEDEAPALFGLAASMIDLSRPAREVMRCFAADGNLADDASPDLGPLRQRVRSLRETISTKISELLSSPKLQPILQDSFFTVRADRYVLPIKASFKNELDGIVHDASGSGQTVFIEPQVVVDLGNRLKIAQSEQLEEEHRILSHLTRLVIRDADPIRRIMHVVSVVDLLSAAARLSIDLHCLAVQPDEGPGFALQRAKHPLLLLQAIAPPPLEGDAGTVAAAPKLKLEDVVGNDFALEPEHRVLVITGPNTGGKTVAMKTIGLFALMVRMGLHLPCGEGSRIGWYEGIEVAIGDQQSIASNLSTFAAHMKALVEIINRVGAADLVLIDEIAADTDPNQGQALGQAILEALAELDAHTVVTTHFERLKAVPFTDPRFRNAGVGFDSERLRPTYRVSLDVPQNSSGFDIAQGLGLPAALVERARELTGDGSQELEALIRSIETRAGELDRAKAEAKAAEDRAARAEAEAEAERRRLNEEIDKVRRRAREELLEEIEASRQEVSRIVAELQKAAGADAVKAAMRNANQAADKLGKLRKAEADKAKAAEAPKPPPGKLETVEVGDWVHVSRVGRDGDVVAIDGKEAHVAVGNIRMRVPIGSLRSAKAKRPKQSARPAPKDFGKKKKKAERKSEEAEEAKVIWEELDVRGATVDECLDRLDTFLDHHYNTPTTHVRVVHGHGTGALRDAVRTHLRRSGYVRQMRPGGHGEGGDGVTVVELT